MRCAAKDELSLNTIRAVKSAIKYKEVEATNKMLDEAAHHRRDHDPGKQRRDAIEEYTKASRPDLAEKEEKELAILKIYLPTQLSAAELAAEK